ncbi:MAG TPA: transcriptional regulator [Terracidiphilus sp.]|nr:transcriptional regulator [Terracidiphilus sp.]
MTSTASSAAAVLGELWVSLASLLRSYTAAHGLNRSRQATVELGEHRITVRHGERWLDLRRSHERVNWMRENGKGGSLELTESGSLRSAAGEEQLDLAAEAWARELMQGADG